MNATHGCRRGDPSPRPCPPRRVSAAAAATHSSDGTTLGRIPAPLDPPYENPGHHDTRNLPGQAKYNPKKSVLPENHTELWNRSVPVEHSGGVLRWSVEGSGKDAVFHRFEPTQEGRYHWSGPTAGQTKAGEARVIEQHIVPSEVRRLAQ